MTNDKQLQEFEKNTTQLQKDLLALAENYATKIPPDVILLAMASVMGTVFKLPGYTIKRNRLKTMLKDKIGI